MLILTDPETLARLRAARERARDLRRALATPNGTPFRERLAAIKRETECLHTASPEALADLTASEVARAAADFHEIDNPAGAERLRRWASTEKRP